jgi:transposase
MDRCAGRWLSSEQRRLDLEQIDLNAIRVPLMLNWGHHLSARLQTFTTDRKGSKVRIGIGTLREGLSGQTRTVVLPCSNGMDAPTLNGIIVPKWKCWLPLKRMGASTMKITTVGIDLAKNVFQVHGIDERGKAVLRKQLRRAQVTVFFANLPPCVIGMEACASAHHWARSLLRFGHTVRLIAPQFVKPYVKTNKNDVADAEAICEAVGRSNMRFVPIKNIEQQAILSVHRVRQGFVKARTAQANQIRGLLGEFGLVIPQGIINIAKRVPESSRMRAMSYRCRFGT